MTVRENRDFISDMACDQEHTTLLATRYVMSRMRRRRRKERGKERGKEEGEGVEGRRMVRGW